MHAKFWKKWFILFRATSKRMSTYADAHNFSFIHKIKIKNGNISIFVFDEGNWQVRHLESEIYFKSGD
jgi:hypothetical protein